MANLITLTAKDGSQVQFYDEIKASGGVKDVYFSPDKSYVVAFYRKPICANDKQRIEDIVNVHRNRIFEADATGKYWEQFFAWPSKIVEWKGLTGIVMPFYDKKFFFSGVDPNWAFMKDGQEKNVDRSAYSIVQTPQTFSVELLKKAYEQPYNPLFTDDASVVEHLGEKVFSVEGNRENIKITTPFDIIVASAVLNNEL